MRSIWPTAVVGVALWMSASSGAEAAWSSLTTQGTTTIIGDQSCASPATNTVVCAARGFANTLVVNSKGTGAWSGWTALAGVVGSSPSCTADGSGGVVCGVRDANSKLAYTRYNGTAWSALTVVGGTLASGPSCASFAAGKVLCTARSSTGGLTASAFNGTTWGAFSSVAASTSFSTVTAPGCAGDGNGGVICTVVLANASNVAAVRYTGTAWTSVLNLSGTANTPPTCTGLGQTGKVACFARGTESAIYVNKFDGGSWRLLGWTGWVNIGGISQSEARCTNPAAGTLICGAIGANLDNALYVNAYNGSTWSGWAKTGGPAIGNPSCVSPAANKALCAIVAPSNKGSSTSGP
ncbi:MAG: hypothetical protein U1E45_20735 [Geminicoccaceae bacterium]